jgi:hypothetical protein
VRIAGGGELDIKGIGTGPGCRPRRGDYTDGLLSLPDALQEYLVEQLLDAILVHAGAEARTLPHYGIIDTGFDGLTAAAPFAAGLVVRRAHLRNAVSDLPAWDTDAHYLSVRLELVLRRYGITSSNWNGFEIRSDGERLRLYSNNEPTAVSNALLCCLVEYLGLEPPFVADRINIQTDAPLGATQPRQIVDFGHYWARAAFDRPLVCMVSDRPMAWGGVVFPTDSAYVQPDSSLIPCDLLWNTYFDAPGAEPGLDEWARPRPRLLRHVAAEGAATFRQSEVDHTAIDARVSDLLSEVTSSWRSGASLNGGSV